VPAHLRDLPVSTRGILAQFRHCISGSCWPFLCTRYLQLSSDVGQLGVIFLPIRLIGMLLAERMKAQLEEIILEMRASRMPYSEALREFRKVFISVVLRELRGNQYKAAEKLRIHRNTLRRTIKELSIDIAKLRPAPGRRHLHQA
jgi:DNA-binding NtrC family response regulator